MIYTPVFLFNGAMCIGAALFASFAKEGRRESFQCAVALGINFLLCAMVLVSPIPLLSIKETWMIADTALGAFCVLAGYRYWWGYAMCALAMAQILLHAAMMEHAIDGQRYSGTLDVVLHAQMAVFFIIGGRGVSDLLRNSLAEFSSPRRSHEAAGDCSEAER